MEVENNKRTTVLMYTFNLCGFDLKNKTKAVCDGAPLYILTNIHHISAFLQHEGVCSPTKLSYWQF